MGWTRSNDPVENGLSRLNVRWDTQLERGYTYGRGLSLRAFNEGLLRPRVARAQEITALFY